MTIDASHVLTIPLFRLNLPINNKFDILIKQLVDTSFELENRERKIRDKTLLSRSATARLFIEGLFQAACCHTPDTAIAAPLSQRFYKESSAERISGYSYRNVKACADALEALQWVTVHKGFVDMGDFSYPTTLSATGDLLAAFTPHITSWHKLTLNGDPIVLREKDSSGHRIDLIPPDNAETDRIRSNLMVLNDFISSQVICLNCPNWQLKKLATRMAKPGYQYETSGEIKRQRVRALNFSQVLLRRIFAKGRLDRGGRFYGAWWEHIPKNFRRYVTINGQPTVEVDFKEIHPRLLYALAGVAPPDDLYDLGIRDPNIPYDATKGHYKKQRDIIKKFINALINDERGVHRLSDTRSKTLGLTHDELIELVFERHPIIRTVLNTDTGLHLQFLDSQIAEVVMLDLKSQGIVALPVHDSFLVREEFQPDLRQAMTSAFEKVVGVPAVLKAEELAKDGFDYLHKDNKTNMTELMEEHSGSFHRGYVLSWRLQNPEPSHPNLSFYKPWLPPE